VSPESNVEPASLDPAAKAELDREFEKLYRDHLKDVYSYSYYRVGNQHDAEDLTEQAFLQAYRHFDRARRESDGRPLRPWLIRIAHNLALNYYRDRSRRPQTPLENADPIAAKSKIGYLPENAPLYTDMTVTSFLKFCAQMRGLSGSAVHAGVQRAIDLCFLDGVRHQSIDTLSKGYRHRTCLAQALLHDPEVLILDEPTDGLDPNQKFEVRQLIKRLGQSKAILFSTHILEEVEAACTRAVIVDRGKIVADGTPAELLAQSGTGSLTDLFRKVTTRDTEAAA